MPQVRVIDRLEPSHIDSLMVLFDQEWWSKGRRRDDVERMLARMDLIVGLEEGANRKLIGFGRVLTDGVYKAIIWDVIVDQDHRGKGFGSLIMNTIFEHPLISQIEHKELYGVRDMEPFYAKWAFSSDLGNLVFMRSQEPNQ